jgi:hypothetical protein
MPFETKYTREYRQPLDFKEERDYQTLINAALKQAIQQEGLATTLRRIVREELTNAQ